MQVCKIIVWLFMTKLYSYTQWKVTQVGNDKCVAVYDKTL